MKNLFSSSKHFKSLFIAIAMASTSLANAAIFMDFNNGAIAGNSTTPGYEKWSDVTSYNWGITSESTYLKGSGAAVGKATPSPFSWVQPQDGTYVSLFVSQILGTSIRDVKVDFTKSGPNGKSIPVFQMDFSDTYLTSLSTSTPGNVLTENAAFVFKKLAITYTPILPNGNLGTKLSATWDVTSQKVSDQFALVYASALAAGAIPSAVPEPSEYLMLLGGMGLMGFAAIRRKKQ